MKFSPDWTVLIAEDDTSLLELMCEVFLETGMKVLKAESGKKALQIIASTSVDLILSDVRMPDGDGVFLAKAIMAKEGNRPGIFFYSGFNDLNKEDLKSLNIQAYFEKPIDFEMVLQKVHDYISNIRGVPRQ